MSLAQAVAGAHRVQENSSRRNAQLFSWQKSFSRRAGGDLNLKHTIFLVERENSTIFCETCGVGVQIV